MWSQRRYESGIDMKIQVLPPKDDSPKNEWDNYYKLKKLCDFEATLDDVHTFWIRAHKPDANAEKILTDMRIEKGLPVL